MYTLQTILLLYKILESETITKIRFKRNSFEKNDALYKETQDRYHDLIINLRFAGVSCHLKQITEHRILLAPGYRLLNWRSVKKGDSA